MELGCKFSLKTKDKEWDPATLYGMDVMFPMVIKLRVPWSMEIAFDAKVQIDTRRSGNNIREEKRGGKYAKNYILTVIYRICLLDKKLTVVDKLLCGRYTHCQILSGS